MLLETMSSAWKSLSARSVHAEFGSAREEQERRGDMLGFVLSLCLVNLFWTSIHHMGLGDRGFAIMGLGVSPVVLALGWVLMRRGGGSDWLTQSTVAVFYAVTAATMFTAAGRWPGGSFAAMLIPVLVILLIGRRASWCWAATALAILAAFLMFASAERPEGVGLFTAITAAQAGHGATCRAVSLLALTVVGVTLFYASFHRRANQAVRDALERYELGERRFQAITENANDLIAELDQQGRFTWVSPGFTEGTGIPPEDLLGRAPSELGHWDDIDEVRAYWETLMEKGAIRQGPVRFWTAMGRSLYLEISLRCYEAAAGEVRVVGVARDVSERVEREGLLRNQESRITVGAMAAGAAHQLNDPISSILAASQYAIALREDADFPETASDSLDVIEEQSHRCVKILRSMLAFVREEEGERWSEDLHQVLHRAVRSIESDEGPLSAEVVMSLCPEAPRVMMSPLEFEQAIINLIRNALQAEASVIVIGTNIAGRRTVEITISDDGTGLSPEAQSAAFDAFFTTHPSDRSGLGLNIARRIVEEHFGSLILTETGEEGSIFQIRLPQLRLLTGGASITS